MPNVKTLEIWTAQTLCDVGILLSIVSLLLHLGRPNFERILGRLTLRVEVPDSRPCVPEILSRKRFLTLASKQIQGLQVLAFAVQLSVARPVRITVRSDLESAIPQRRIHYSSL